jgi:hypothetical protein
MKTKRFCFLKAFFLSIGFFTVLGLVATETVAAATYYVATNGSDSNPGTEAQPFKTVQRGVDAAYAGDTVTVKDGTYTYGGASGGYFVTLRRSGAPGQFITIKSQNLHGALMDGNNNLASRVFYCGQSYSYIRIEGFEIKGASEWGIQFYPGVPHHVELVRNKIHDIGRYYTNTNYGLGAIFTPKQSHDFLIDGNIMHTIGRTGGTNDWHDQVIYLCGHTHTVSNNLFYTDSNGWSGACVSVSAEYDANDGSNHKIVNNTFCNPCRVRPGHVWFSTVVPNQITGTVVSNNIFYGPTEAPIWAWVESSMGIGTVTVRSNITNAPKLISTLGNWNGNTIVAANNLFNTDPQFVDAANRNYRLRSGSPAISHAFQADAPDHDIDQQVRPQGGASDAGAYEYQESNPPPQSENDPPVVSILNPANDVTITEGETITFKAMADDQEDGNLSETIVWTSDNPGSLGVGAEISSTLPVGQHTVTAAVTDSGGLTETATIMVTVAASPLPPTNQAPTVSILAPANGSNFPVGSSITFSGEANDPDESDQSANIEWNSNVDGHLATGANFERQLSKGNHTVTATVSDSGGLTASNSVQISVNESPLTPMHTRLTFYSSRSFWKVNLGLEVMATDNNEQPVSGANITVDLYRRTRFWKTFMLTTDRTGLAEIYLGRQRNFCYKAILKNVQAEGYLWSGNDKSTEYCP